MKERYSRVYTTKENLYTEGAPIMIRAGTLLEDSETGNIIAQLKFCNVSGRTISYVKVAVQPMDEDENPIGALLAYEYAGLSAGAAEEFGSKKPLLMPDAATQSFHVGVCAVAFEDGTMWEERNTDWQPAAKESPVFKALDAVGTYRKAVELFLSEEIKNVRIAKELFESIQEYRDVTAELKQCEDWLARKKGRRKKGFIWFAIVTGSVAMMGLLWYLVLYPFVPYNKGDYRPYMAVYQVEEFEVPDDVKAINPDAFNMCKNLKKVTIPSGVTTIGANAFADCSNLESVSIPGSVMTIDQAAFKNCAALKHVRIPAGVTVIKDEAFKGCTNLESIVIPRSVTVIGKYAFEDCTKLESVVIEGGEIDQYAFKNCTGIVTATIGEGVTGIGWGAFTGCGNLESITIPKTVTEISGSAFENCAKLNSVTIESGVTGIGWAAFQGCVSLEKVTVPATVTFIDGLAFANCEMLQTVTMAEGISKIGWHAFSGCAALERITIPRSVTNVDASFAECKALQHITYKGAASQWKTILKTYTKEMTDIEVSCSDKDCRYEN